MPLESDFQGQLITKLEERFPGCMVLKNNPNYITGIPDLLVLYGDRWAALECKRSAKEPSRPLQPYYREKMNGMSFAAKIYPENSEEIINAMERSFRANR